MYVVMTYFFHYTYFRFQFNLPSIEDSPDVKCFHPLVIVLILHLCLTRHRHDGVLRRLKFLKRSIHFE